MTFRATRPNSLRQPVRVGRLRCTLHFRPHLDAPTDRAFRISLLGDRFGSLWRLMVAASQWRRAAAASMRCHDGHHPRDLGRCQERQHRLRWCFRAAVLCSRRVRAAAAAEWANFQRLACAIGEGDAGVLGGGPCVLREVRMGQCRNHGGVAVVRIAVASKMERFARRCAPSEVKVRTSRKPRMLCRESGDVLNASVYLTLRCTTDSRASGAQSLAFKDRHFFTQCPLGPCTELVVTFTSA